MDANKKIDEQIDRVLIQEPSFRLPDGFADRLILMIEASRKRERRFDLLLMSAGAFLFLIATVVVLFLVDFRPSLTGLTFLNDHIGLVGFAIVFIALLNLVDKKLVRKHQVS